MINTNKSPLSIKLIAVGLFTIFFLLFKYGNFENEVHLMIAIGIGLLIFFLLFIFIVIIPTINAKKSIQKFAINHSFQIQKKIPSDIILPDVFFRLIPEIHDTMQEVISKKVPSLFNISILSGAWVNPKIINKVRNFIKVNQNFFIFINSQNISASHGHNQAQRHLCFLFNVTAVLGYHKIIYAENKIFKDLTTLAQNTIAKNNSPRNNFKVLANDPTIDKNFSFLSNNATEFQEIMCKISHTLIKIDQKLSPLRISQSGIDTSMCKMKIDITEKYALVRFEYFFSLQIEEIYILMCELQKALSPIY